MFQPPFLDRLIGEGPNLHWNVDDLKQAVKRDLEWLLNSRRILAEVSPRLKHVRQSTLTHGLPELGSFDLGSPSEVERLRMAVQEAIACFEPRLARVQVIADEGPVRGRSLRFRIEGFLRVEPRSAVVFDTVLKLDEQAFLVREQAP